MEVREDVKGLQVFVVADPFDHTELRYRKVAFRVFDPVEDGVDLPNHLRFHGFKIPSVNF